MVISVVETRLSVVVMIFVSVVDRSVVSVEEDVDISVVVLIVEISLDGDFVLGARVVLGMTVVDSSYVEDVECFLLVVIKLLVEWVKLPE